MSDDNDTTEPTLVDKIEKASWLMLEWAGIAAVLLWVITELGYWYLGWFM